MTALLIALLLVVLTVPYLPIMLGRSPRPARRAEHCTVYGAKRHNYGREGKVLPCRRRDVGHACRAKHGYKYPDQHRDDDDE